MSIRVTVNLDPLDETNDRVEAAAYFGLARAALYVHSVVVPLTPLDTGHLRSSEDVLADGDGGFEIYVPGPYARFQEFGPNYDPWVLKHEEGQSPYLSAGLEEGGPGAIEIIAQTIRDEGSFT